MPLVEELSTIAAEARRHAEPGEELTGVIAAEPEPGLRVYLCAYGGEATGRTWLALDGGGVVGDRRLVREAVAIAALCELAEEAAGGGSLDELRAQLVALRLTENPPGIEEAEAAALALEEEVGATPRVASPALLDRIGAATLRLEGALGEDGPSPFAQAMQLSAAAVESLQDEVEATYRAELS